MFKIKVKATRTKHFESGLKSSKAVTVTIERRYHKRFKTWWIYITDGGVTGFETLREKSLSNYTDWGWLACAETERNRDSLVINCTEMAKISEALKKYKKENSWLGKLIKRIKNAIISGKRRS